MYWFIEIFVFLELIHSNQLYIIEFKYLITIFFINIIYSNDIILNQSNYKFLKFTGALVCFLGN